jgi:hypothetical protein
MVPKGAVMTKRTANLSNESLSALIQLFAEAATQHIRVWEDVKRRIANKAYDTEASIPPGTQITWDRSVASSHDFVRSFRALCSMLRGRALSGIHSSGS